MTDILFQMWFSATWQAMALTAVVFLVTFTLRDRLQPRWRYLLWCVVLLRLALPVLPQTPWGIWNESPGSAGFQPANTRAADTQPTIPQYFPPKEPQQEFEVLELPKPVFVQKPIPPLPPSRLRPIASSLFLAAWLIGFAFLLAKQLRNEIRFRRQCRFWKNAADPNLLALFESCRKEAGVRQRITLKTAAGNVGAGCFGVARPIIVLSEAATKMDEKELRMILIHELVHLKRFDPLVLRLSTILSLIHWPNPLVWFVLSRLQRERELACDAAVLHILGQHKQKEYGLAILAFAERFPCRDPIPGLVGIFEKNGTARRINMIINFKRSKWPHALLGLLLITLLAAIGLSRAQTNTNAVQEEVAQTSTVDDTAPDDYYDDYDDFNNWESAKPEDIKRYNETQYTIPDGSPEEIVTYIRQTLQGGAFRIDGTKEGREFFDRQWRTLREAAEKGLAGNPEGETRKELLGYKMQGFTGPLPRKELFSEFEKFVEELESNPLDKEVAAYARGRYLEAWNNFYSRVKRPTPGEFIAHRKAVLDFAKKAENYQQLLGLDLVSVAGKLKDRALALETAKMVREMFENSSSEFNRSLAYRAEGVLHIDWLKQDKLRIVGITFDDKKFDLAALRGKPVVVIYWSPQSGALESILPKLKTAYEKYHARGLEIVGVCCDITKDPNVEPVTKEELQALPWSVNISEAKTVAAGLPSNREYYDLFHDHFFLTDAQGKVKLNYFAVAAIMGGMGSPPKPSYFRGVGETVDGKFVAAEDLLVQELDKMFTESKPLAGGEIIMAKGDVIVFENGVWKNEKTGETIPDGTIVKHVQKDKPGILLLTRSGDMGKIEVLKNAANEGVAGDQAVAKSIRISGDSVSLEGGYGHYISYKSLAIKTVDETGKSLGNVDIRVHLPDFKDENRPKTTDEQGNMILALPDSPKELFVSANAPGRVSQIVHWDADDMSSGTKLPKSVTFTLRKGITIGGVVVDPDGKPIEGAVIQVFSRPNGYGMPGHLKPADSHILAYGDGKANTFGGVTSCKTDRDGRWTLDNVPSGKFYPVEIEITHPEFQMNDELGRTSFASQNEALIERLRKGEYRFTMKRGISVSGTVRDANGQPIKDAWVVPGGDPFYYHNDREKAVRTDAQGKYRVGELRAGSGTITVIAEGFAPDMKESDFEKDSKPLDFELKPGKTISFRIIDEKGQPIPRAKVSIGGNPDNWWRDGSNIYNMNNANTKIPVYADDEGIYRWTWAPEDRLRFTFHKDGFLMRFQSETDWFTARAEPYEIVLHHKKTFRGTVVDATTLQPVKEYKIVYGALTNDLPDVDNYTWQLQEQTFTGIETFQYIPSFLYDNYWLRFTADGYAPSISGPYPLNEEPPTIKIALKRMAPSQILSGRVLLPSGHAAAEAEILLVKEREYARITPPNIAASTDGRSRSVIKTDNQGRFRLELPSGNEDYRLYASHSGGFAQIDKADIKAGEVPTLHLKPYGKLEIKIPYDTKPDAYNRFHLNHVNKTVFDEKKQPLPQKMLGSISYQGNIPPDGTVVIDNIAPGKYDFQRLARNTQRGGSVYNVTNFSVEISPGETKPWDLTFPNGVNITARIRLPEDYEGEFTAKDWNASEFSFHSETPDKDGQSSMNWRARIRSSENDPREGVVEVERVAPGPSHFSVMVRKSGKREPNTDPISSLGAFVGVTMQKVTISPKTNAETSVFDLGTIEVSSPKP